jgi:hypothetical protein
MKSGVASTGEHETEDASEVSNRDLKMEMKVTDLSSGIPERA